MASSRSFSNPSQVLQRNESLFAEQSILVAGFIDDDYPIQLEQHASSSCFCFNDFRYYAKLKDKLSDSEVYFTDNFQGSKQQEKFDLLLIYLPKAKQETEYLLANLTPHLKSDAKILLVGEKKGGIKSAAGLLKNYTDNSNIIDSARHCSLVYAELNKTVPTFDQAQWLKRFTLSINNISLTICSLPGVFSHGELDKGSELLLNNLPDKLVGSALDFGCGAGVLSCFLLKKHQDLSLDLIDVNVYALASAKLTLKENQLTANVFASNVFSNVDKQYDLLISNPPFHSGRETNYDAAETFINQSTNHLKKQGNLTLVANKFLRYEPLLLASYKNINEIVKNNKFKVLNCIKN